MKKSQNIIKPKNKNNKNRNPRIRRRNNNNISKGLSKNENIFAPASFGSKTSIVKPSFGKAKGANTVITHSEYISDINGSVNFVIALTLNCNPGLQASFPWLSQIANAYEKFIVKKIQYRYEPETPTTVTGSVFLSPEYNPQDVSPVSKTETFQNEDTVRAVPWTPITCQIPTKYLRVYNDYFVRSGTLPSSQDLKTYDPLVMYVCTQGQANTNLLGEIWMDYEIELINPQGNLNPVSGSGSSGATLTSAHIFNGLVTFGPLSIGATSTTNVLTLTPLVIGAEYEVVVAILGTSLLTLTVSTLVGGTSVNLFPSNVISGGTAIVCIQTFTATAQTATLTYTSTGTTFSQSYVSVTAIPAGAF